MKSISGILGKGEWGIRLGSAATRSGVGRTVWRAALLVGTAVEDVWCIIAFSIRLNRTLAWLVSNVKVPGPESHRLPASMVKASYRDENRATHLGLFCCLYFAKGASNSILTVHLNGITRII